MKVCYLRVWVALMSTVWLSSAAGGVVFQDGFEADSLGALWTVSGTNQMRVTVSSNYGPAGGEQHLILDDASSDAVSSVTEATLALDLSNRKNVVLSFKVKSLGNDAHPPPFGNFSTARNYDGVAISVNGGGNWRTVQSLSAVGGGWEIFSIS